MTSRSNRSALTIIEAMIAVFIFGFVCIGATLFLFNAVRETRRATLHDNAARLALLLCDTWRALAPKGATDPNDPNTFNPVTTLGSGSNLNMSIANGSAFTYPTGFSTGYLVNGGGFKITMTTRDLSGNKTDAYYAQLSYMNNPTGDTALKLRALNVTIRWGLNGGDPGYNTATNKSFLFTTYIQLK